MKNKYEQLTTEYDAFMKVYPKINAENRLIRTQNLLENIIKSGKHISDRLERNKLSVLARNLAEIIFNISDEYPLVVRLDEFVPPPNLGPQVPFANREDEIREILSPSAPAYYLVDAPDGYGKSVLLKQLQRRFEEREWRTAYVALSNQDTVADLSLNLASHFKLFLLPEPIEGASWGYRLGGLLLPEWNKNKTSKKGLLFLIDLADNPSAAFIRELLEDFIPSVENSLRNLASFRHKEHQFRVVLAGSYLAGRPEAKLLPLRVLRLFPFDYQEVQNSTRDYLTNYDEHIIRQLSAHLFYFTGGHPGCMGHILDMYKKLGLTPERLLSASLSQEIWQHVLIVAQEISNSVQKQYENIYEEIDKLTIFRYVDYAILNRMAQNVHMTSIEDGYDLADELTGTYLFDWEGRFLQNNITRRILTILLRKQRPDEFNWRCKEARSMCAERLDNFNVQVPEKWTIEYLFQSLQQHANVIQDARARQVIRQEFLDKDLPNALQKFISGRQIQPKRSREEQKILKQTIKKDTEFCFTLKYYLREDQYSEKPYTILQQKIDEFFALYQKGGTFASVKTVIEG